MQDIFHSPPTKPSKAATKISSSQLFADQKELVITHEGQEYCLRITRNGKLILTK